jgi:TPR repeat protein
MKHATSTLLIALAMSATAHATPADDVKKADAALQAGDLPTAMSLLRKASDANHPLAQARLADLLRAAEFEKEAFALYSRSAQQGEPAGQVGLGRAYADGVGVPRDAKLALEWYRKAGQKDYGPAFDQLARAYRTGDLGLPKDLAKAAEYDARAKALAAAAKAAP